MSGFIMPSILTYKREFFIISRKLISNKRLTDSNLLEIKEHFWKNLVIKSFEPAFLWSLKNWFPFDMLKVSKKSLRKQITYIKEYKAIR